MKWREEENADKLRNEGQVSDVTAENQENEEKARGENEESMMPLSLNAVTEKQTTFDVRKIWIYRFTQTKTGSDMHT